MCVGPRSTGKAVPYTLGVAIPSPKVLKQMADQYGESVLTVKSWFTHDPDEILNSADVAEMLKVDIKHARKLMNAGRIKCTKVGREWRTTRAHLLAFLDGVEEH